MSRTQVYPFIYLFIYLKFSSIIGTQQHPLRFCVHSYIVVMQTRLFLTNIRACRFRFYLTARGVVTRPLTALIAPVLVTNWSIRFAAVKLNAAFLSAVE